MGNRREFLTAAAAFAAGTVSVGTADAAEHRIVTILNGKGHPPSVWGIVGDFYIDDSTHQIWGPRRRSGWGKPTALIGRAGSAGPAGSGVGATGPAGPQGYSVLHGDGPPAASLGEDNDFYIDTGATQLYGPREGDVWGSPVSLTGSDETPAGTVTIDSGGDPRLRRVTAPYLRGQVAVTRCGQANGTAVAAHGAFTGRVVYTTGPTATADLRFCFSNWASVVGGASEGNPGAGSPCSVKAAIEFEQASVLVSFPIWFNGVRTVSIVDGGEVWSDPVGIELPAGATFYVRVLYTPGASLYPEANIFSTATDSWVAGDSVDGTDALSSTDVGQGLYRPTAITGTPVARVPQVLILGDERAMGIFDSPSYGSYIDTALDGNFVTVNLGADQDSAAMFAADHPYRGRFIAGCDYAIEGYAGKDVDNSSSLTTAAALAAVQAARISIWQACAQRGLTVYADTLPPYTSSTDGWTTTGNQTLAWSPNQETCRWQMNQWLRAGAPMKSGVAVTPGTSAAIVAGDSDHPLAGVIDDAATIETHVNQYGQGADSGIWKVGSGGTALTPNGYSQNAAGCALSAASVPVGRLT